MKPSLFRCGEASFLEAVSLPHQLFFLSGQKLGIVGCTPQTPVKPSARWCSSVASSLGAVSLPPQLFSRGFRRWRYGRMNGWMDG